MAAKQSTGALLATHGGGLRETESIFALLILSGCLFPTSAGGLPGACQPHMPANR